MKISQVLFLGRRAFELSSLRISCPGIINRLSTNSPATKGFLVTTRPDHRDHSGESKRSLQAPGNRAGLDATKVAVTPGCTDSALAHRHCRTCTERAGVASVDGFETSVSFDPPPPATR